MILKKILKKGSKSVSLLLEDDSEIVIHYEVFMKNGLRKGDLLSEDRISFLLNEHKKQLAKESAFRLLSRRLHSVKELKLKLAQKKFGQEIIQAVVDELQLLNFLDDYRFTEMFTLEMIQKKRLGTNKIKAELFKRGIKDNIIKEILLKLIPDSFNENALHLAQKKLSSLKYKEFDNKTLKQKLASFLYSKGYDFDTINTVLNDLLNKNGASDFAD